MFSNSTYYECLGIRNSSSGQPSVLGEDFHCSDMLSFELSKYKQYIRNHRFYFEVRVPPYGKAGCDPSKPEGDHTPGDEDDDEPETPPADAFVENIHNNVKRKFESVTKTIKSTILGFFGRRDGLNNM